MKKMKMGIVFCGIIILFFASARAEDFGAAAVGSGVSMESGSVSGGGWQSAAEGMAKESAALQEMGYPVEGYTATPETMGDVLGQIAQDYGGKVSGVLGLDKSNLGQALGGNIDESAGESLQQYTPGTYHALTTQTTYQNGVKVVEINRFPELLNAAAGNGAYQIYNIKGSEIYDFVFASPDDWEKTFERFWSSTEENVATDDVLSEQSIPSGAQGFTLDMSIAGRVFTQAENSGIQLNSDEITLKNNLLNMGLLVYQNGEYESPSAAAIISFNPNQEKKSFQASTVDHELSHALFITNPAYKAAVETAWSNLPVTEQDLAKEELYIYNKDLFITEYAAYCCSQPAGVKIYSGYHSQEFRDLYQEYKGELF